MCCDKTELELSAVSGGSHMFLTSQKFVLTIFQLSCVTRTSSKVVQMAHVVVYI